MISLSDIHKYLKLEDYDGLYTELNKSLDAEDDNAMYYFYRFLTLNHDYFHMDFNDLVDEMDLAKARELEKNKALDEYSYSNEYFFFRGLDKKLRAIFIYANRMEKDRFISAINEKISILDESFYSDLENYILALNDELQIRLTLIAIKKVYNSINASNKNLAGLEKLKNCYIKLSSTLENSSFYLITNDINDDIYHLDHPFGERRITEGHYVIGNNEIEIKEGVLIKYCISDLNVVIPDKTKVIPKGFFMGENIKSVYIPSSVKRIEKEAFRDCKNLVSITFSEGLEEIGEHAFSGCKKLTSIHFPSSLRIIGNEALYGCMKLVEIYNPSNVFINQKDFSNNYFIPTIHNTNRGASHIVTFKDCQFISAKNQYYLINYIGNDSMLTLPDSIKDHSYDIYQNAFEDEENLKVIVIPGNINTIKKNAFLNCKNLAKVMINYGLEVIDSCAFMGCSRLSTIVLPSTLKSISRNAFTGCDRLIEIYNPSKIDVSSSVSMDGFFKKAIHTSMDTKPHILEASNFQFVCVNKEYYLFNYYGLEEDIVLPVIKEFKYSIFKDAFKNNTRIKNVKIPNGVLAIGDGAFSGCSRLKSVFMGEDILAIGKDAFNCCTSISTIQIGANVKEIGAFAFNNCTNLACITFPKSVLRIGHGALYGCKKLVEIYNLSWVNLSGNEFEVSTGLFQKTIHLTEKGKSHLITFGDYQFILKAKDHEYCLINYLGSNKEPSLPKTIFGHKYSIYHYAFYANTTIVGVKIPKEVLYIGAYAFSECKRLSSITIPSNIYMILNSSFSHCQRLVDVTLDEGINQIGSYAFYDCINLDKVYLPKSLYHIDNSAFPKNTKVIRK